MNQDRESLDEALANMFSSTKYSNSYLFYAHIISQCTIKLDNNMEAPAGIAFNIDHYNLYINMDLFKKYPLEQRLGILKHEVLHITNNHVLRTEDRIHLPWNYSTDCAINQEIERDHLPDFAIYPDTFPVKSKIEQKMHAEYYYDLLKDEDNDKEGKSECSNCNGTGEVQDTHSDSENGKEGTKTCECCNGTGHSDSGGYKNSNSKVIDSHNTWQKSQGDKDLQKDVTKGMLEQAINETQKSRGTLPENISEMLSLFTRKPQVDWKKVLKRITSNKKSGKRPTIIRKPRRFKNRPDLKGVQKDRTFTLVVGLDVSGSMTTNEIMQGLNEIHHICKLTNTKMKLIQIDATIHGIKDFSAKTKLINRKGCGGTYMGDCPKYIKDNNIECDALVMISDMYIEDVPSDEIWKSWKKRTIWLATDKLIPDWNGWNKHTVLPLNV